MTRSNRIRRFEHLESRCLLAGDLRITEVNYHPHASMTQFGERDVEADDYEFIEVANLGDARLNLRNYEFTDGVEFKFDTMFLNPGERVVIVQDPKDFTFRYGRDPKFAAGNGGGDQDQGEFKGSLRNGGERIIMKDPDGRVVHEFTFFDSGEWPNRADGLGSTLEVVDPFGDYNDPKNWRASSEYGGSPSAEGNSDVDVVVNELLTHTDLPQIDAIELYNTTQDDINVAGWYLTDSLEEPFRYQIPLGDMEIGPEEYMVFDEVQLGFRFDGQQADSAFIIESNADGKPIRFADAVSFSATQNGISLGRWDNGQGDLFPMIWLSFDDDNPGPYITDIVISEVNYHPGDVPGVRADDLEFIELLNRSNLTLDLSHWQITKAVEYSFPAGVSIEPDSAVLLVGFDPIGAPQKLRRFIDTYGISDNIAIYGPYSDSDDPNADQLDDDGETIILQRPEDLEQLGLGYVLVDRLTYRDSGEWPSGADGGGMSLTRVDPEAYGDFASSWRAAVPSPSGQGMVGDVDQNGEVNADDIDQLCLAIALGGGEKIFDFNRDGAVDLLDHEFIIGDILNTSIGDANLDGRFDSTDFVEIFVAGQYEDDETRNSGWATGDWNCDGEFDSGDLVAAFVAGSFVAESVGSRVDIEIRHIEKPSAQSDEDHSADRGGEPVNGKQSLLHATPIDYIFAENARDIARPVSVATETL